MEWSEDLGGLRLCLYRNPSRPETVIVECDIQNKDLLTTRPRLKIEFVTQRLKGKWQGLVFKGGNKASKVAFDGELPFDTHRSAFEIKAMPFFDFSGTEIESFCIANLFHTGSLGEKRIANPFPLTRPKYASAACMTEPPDTVNQSAYFSRLSVKAKVEVLLFLLVIGGAFVALLTYGFSVEIWKGGEGQGKLWVFTLLALYAIGRLGWPKLLRRYLSVEKSKTTKIFPIPNQNYSLSQLVSGVAEIDIEQVTFRVVCCNRERYRFLQDTGRSSAWVDRFCDFNGLILYQQKVARIPAGSSLSDFLPKTRDISFDEMFANLYPQAMVSKHYGISVYWEVQIIHDEYADIEIPVVGIDRHWPFEYFFSNDKRKN